MWGARLAGEADAKAREVQPKAVQALEGLRKQVQEWQGAGSGTNAKGLHSLASSRLAAWCAMHVDDATSYQASPQPLHLSDQAPEHS